MSSLVEPDLSIEATTITSLPGLPSIGQLSSNQSEAFQNNAMPSMAGMTVYLATSSDLTPCCYISESGWTWFACTLLIVSLLLIATIKYYKKVLDNGGGKHDRVLRMYALARQRGATNTKMPEGPVSLDEFRRLAERRREKPVILRIEFSSATQMKEKLTTNIGMSEINQPKNRDSDIVPYDTNRVILNNGKDKSKEDYINASFVGSLVDGPGYIVTQGPLENTVNDFWAMVWQQKVQVIVMLTRTFDFIKVQCVQYWPAKLGSSEEYNGLRVTVTKEVKFANFLQRSLTLCRTKSGSTRQMTHFHYTEWPAYSNLLVRGSLLDFRRRVARTIDQYGLGGPCLVHCDTGTGRSGVFIELDGNVRWAEQTKTLDVYGFLKRLRAHRMGLVETEEHYRLVYQLLEEYTMCGETSWSVDSFLDRIRVNEGRVRSVSQYNVQSGVDHDKEFLLVSSLVPEFSMGDCAGGHRADNRDKNRHALIVPPDSHRPYITSFQGNECTDYINAVFVDGFTRNKEFIVTEWPMCHTLPDFWSMVYDHDVSAIVLLDNPNISKKFPAIFPEQGCSKKYGGVFSVENADDDAMEETNIASFSINVSKKEVAPHRRTQAMNVDEKQGRQISSLTDLMVSVVAPSKKCKVFQLKSWGASHKVPQSPQCIIDLIKAIRRWSHKYLVDEEDTPTLVVSSDGCSRVGVFCSAMYLKDKLGRDGEVDVVQAVKVVRTHRTQLVGDITEYKFCYDVVEQLIGESQYEQLNTKL